MCWIRQAHLVFGSTTQAVSTVVAVFFLGLAIGSALFGRWSTRIRRPLRAYSWLEIGAGGLALLTPLAFAATSDLYGVAFRAFPDGGAGLLVLRVLLVAVVILPPTVLLGGTLPLFVRHFVARRDGILGGVAGLYSLNTLGATAGCLLAGLVLVPWIGVSGALRVGALAGIASGAVVWLLDLDRGSRVSGAGSARPAKSVSRLVPVLFFLVGAVALANQVLWTRHLSLLVRTTVVTYTLSIGIMLAGIVLGSGLAAVLFRREKRLLLAFGGLQAASGILFLTIASLAPETWGRLGAGIVPIAVLLLPPSVLSGASFPVAIRLVVAEPKLAGAGVGRMTALNTLGGITGSLVAGFLLLPEVGLQASIRIVSAAGIAGAVVAWLWLDRRSPTALRGGLCAMAVLAWLVVPAALPTRVPLDFIARQGEVVDFREGLGSNVAVLRGERGLRLEIDGWWQGEDRKNHQIMAAHLPMILHSSPRDVLLVGAGTGQTARRFLMYPVESLDCVDIEPAVFEVVGEHFDSAWMDDDRTRLILEDGRNWLAHTDREYDLISLELGQIFRPGVASFYTVDFYRVARERLRPGGLVSQFVPLPFLTEDQFRTVLASFREVFSEASLWYNTSELLLLGRPEPLVLEPERLDVLRDPVVHDDLAYAHWGGPAVWLHRPEAFLASFLCGPGGVAAMSGRAMYRDDLPVLEYETVSVTELELRELPTVELISGHLDPIESLLPEASAPLLARAAEIRSRNLGDLAASAYVRRVDGLKGRGDLPGIERVLSRALEHNPENVLALRLMGDVLLQLGRSAESLGLYERALDGDPDDFHARRGLAFALHVSGRIADAIPHYRAARVRRPGDHEVTNALAGALAQTGELAEARALLEELVRERPDFGPARENLERVRDAAGATRAQS